MEMIFNDTNDFNTKITIYIRTHSDIKFFGFLSCNPVERRLSSCYVEEKFTFHLHFSKL
jgi:hypothetical protein